MNTAYGETTTSFSMAQQLQLRPAIQGTVITPDDPQYDKARQAWNLSVDQRPAMIVIADGVEDVVGAVRFAAQAGLNLTVQGTGHGVVRPANDSLLLNTSKMKTVRVDAAAQTAWVEAGVKWGEVLEKTQAVGLAPLLGSSPDVGVVGYTLGGGYGWLGRKYGLATDSVRFFELVTADGRLLRASETENSDLFWGLRGGGGSFGIITGMEIKLYPVSTVYGGNLFYPLSMAKEVYARYRDWITSVPDELTSSIVIMNYPPIPEIPEFLRGQSFVIIRGLYCGPVQEGEALLQSWRDWRAPYFDGWRVMPFSEVGTVSAEPLDPMPIHSSGAWLAELGDEVIDILLRTVAPGSNGPSPLIFAEIRHVGGAVARVSPQASAYGNRDAAFLLHLLGVTPTPEAYRQLAQYTGQIKEQLRPYLTGGVYMNFLEGEESQRRVESGYAPEAYRRLAALKAAYDPDNRLRSGFNIQPVR
ncbi:MAG: FAD-binding oxidoreductase [Anaerolineae bacterium]|nr:FAD-binding oxidoreductase [Anaerolineae bacterium]